MSSRMPQMYGWKRSIERAASRTVRISFEASFEACFARKDAVGAWGGLLLPPGRGTILIAS